MELFYQHPYEDPLYETEELEILKTLQANVVHEIMYHFVVVKHNINDQELELMSRSHYPEPHVLVERRLKSQNRHFFYNFKMGHTLIPILCHRLTYRY